MKKTKLLSGLLAFAVTATMFAAPVAAQAAVYEKGEKSYYYDTSESDWILQSEQEYTRSKSGKTKGYLTKYVYTNYESDGSVSSKSTETYKYDSKGRTKTITCKSTGTASEGWTDKYTYKGNKTTVKFYDADGKYTGKEISTSKKTSTVYVFYDSENNITGKDIYKYDSKGNIKSYTYYSEGELSYKAVYKYSGGKIKEVKYTSYSGDEKTVSTEKRTYKKGYTIIKEYDSEGTLERENKYKTKRDNAGHMINVYSKYYYSDGSSYTSKYKNTMIKSGKFKGCLKQYVISSEGNPSSKTVYSYINI